MKKILMPLLVGFGIFILGIIAFSFEIKGYSTVDELYSSFIMKEEIIEYKINEEDVYKITNSGNDTNIDLYIDNNVSNKIRIVVSHPVMTNIDYEYSTSDDGDFIEIDFDSSFELNFDNLKSLFVVGMDGLKTKLKPNYDLLEYPIIKVFVNEKYKDNIKFVGKYGKVYSKIR